MIHPNNLPQEPSVTLVMTGGMVKGISDALMQAPYYIAQPIIDEMNRQIQAQQPRITGVEMKMAPPDTKGDQDATSDTGDKQH